MIVSAWNNAALQQRFLPYNFRPKTEWPTQTDDLKAGLELRRATAPLTDPLMEELAAARSMPDDLPPASIFKPETPRFPNVWFYGSQVEFPTYKSFIDSLSRRFQADGYTSDAVSLNEGADLALSIENLQPWTSVGRLSHDHAVHIRFFWRRLEDQQAHRTNTGDWRVAASIHYEVEHANPLHADVEVCPFCGRTGVYAKKEGNLVERVHDPLGLELLLWGTIRGERVRDRLDLGKNIIVAKPTRNDMNTEAIAFVKL